jgi:hypothetical protein
MCEDVDRIPLVQDRGQWKACVYHCIECLANIYGGQSLDWLSDS